MRDINLIIANNSPYIFHVVLALPYVGTMYFVKTLNVPYLQEYVEFEMYRLSFVLIIHELHCVTDIKGT